MIIGGRHIRRGTDLLIIQRRTCTVGRAPTAHQGLPLELDTNLVERRAGPPTPHHSSLRR
jgi:hypothetical protein